MDELGIFSGATGAGKREGLDLAVEPHAERTDVLDNGAICLRIGCERGNLDGVVEDESDRAARCRGADRSARANIFAAVRDVMSVFL